MNGEKNEVVDVERLSKECNAKKKVIQIMMIIAKKHGYSYKETEEIIKEFYLKK